MVQLTPSGEVAQFIDDNQFGSGQSVDKCGPEAVSLFWHSVAPGQHNPYTSADVHAMAHDDYEKYIGKDVSSDHAGTSNATLYKMLSDHGFHFFIGPLNLDWVKGWLSWGYPVILGGVQESTVFDLGINGNPYNWNTAGLFHIILASGQGAAGELLVRDTANIDKNGTVRPGPRRYREQGLSFTTATMVVPSWLPIPGNGNPPAHTPPPPPPPPATDYKKLAEAALKSAEAALAQAQDALTHLS